MSTQDPQPDTSNNEAQDAAQGVALGALKYGFLHVKTLAAGWGAERAKGFKPIGTFLDRSKLSLPSGASDLVSRVKTNLTYFQTNYLLVFVFLLVLGVILNPSLLFWAALVIGMWYYCVSWRQEPFQIRGNEIPNSVVQGVLVVLTFIILYFASIGNVLLWLLVFTLGFVALHSMLYVPPEVDEFGFGTGESTVPPEPNAQV